MAHGWDQKDVDAVLTRRQADKTGGGTTIAAPAKASPPRQPTHPTGAYDPFLALLTAHGLPAPETEYRFHADRQFRADYAWPAQKLIVERMGGLWSSDARAKKAHAMPLKILRDYEKSNLAQLAGWTYLQFTPDQLDRGLVLETLKIRLLG